MAFHEVFSFVFANSLREEVVFRTIPEFLKVEVAGVEIASDLKFWV